MTNLKYHQLLVISDSTKSGNLFKFSKKLNLITASDNSVGKSTLVKLIHWALGCEPFFDTTWINLDCKVILRFSLDNTEYEVHRYKSIINFREKNSEFKEFTTITGEYSKMLADLFEFKALLPNRNTEKIETPPPAYYFLPFYIDQKKSWANSWDNFDKLGQYANWKSTIIKYHVGLLTPKHFDIEEDIYNNKETNKELNVKIEKLQSAVEVVREYVPQENITIDEEIFLELTEEIKIQLNDLGNKQESLLETISIVESDKSYLTQQAILSENIIKSLDADYKFTVENIEEDELECPLCGIIHENSIINRASILTDKQQAESQLKEIKNEITKKAKKSNKINLEILDIRREIKLINEKYSFSKENVPKIEFSEIIESFAATSIESKVLKSKAECVIKSNDLQTINKGLKKDQKNLITDEYKQEVTDSFISTLSSYVQLLDAEGVNLSEITQPTDSNKIVKEGGAAEGTRGILAYYLTIFSLINKFGNEKIAPFVIDTPNQQEQSFSNYDKIVELITTKFPEDSQIILCAMENEQLKPFMDIANIITLNESKILKKEMYSEIKEEFNKIKAGNNGYN